MKKTFLFTVLVSLLMSMSATSFAAYKSSSSSYKSSSYKSSNYKSSSNIFDRKSEKVSKNSVTTQSKKDNKNSVTTQNKIDNKNSVTTQSKKDNKNSVTTQNKIVKNEINISDKKPNESLEKRKNQEKIKVAQAKVEKRKAKDLKKYQESIEKDKKKKGLKNIAPEKYQSSRDQYYSEKGIQQPIVINNSRSDYGMWDSIFMWSILSNLNNNSYAGTYYNNMNSNEFREWRNDADELAKDNIELKNKLAELDRKIEDMKANGVEAIEGDTGDLPSYVYASKDAITVPDVGVLNIGVASKNGMYNKYCELMKEKTKSLEINCIENEGSVKTLSSVNTGSVNAGFVQSDVFLGFKDVVFDIKSLQSNFGDEYVYLITSKNSEITSISDFENGTDKKLYSVGSGSRFTMKAFSKIDDNYEKAYEMAENNKLPVDVDSFKLITKTNNAAIIFVCSLNCPLMKNINESELGKQLKLVPVDDWDFNNKLDEYGNLVYEFKDLSGDDFNNLIPKSYGMTGSVETISMKTVFVINEDWFKYNEEKTSLELENLLYDIKNEIK